jgi:hypothetical protein
MVNDAERVRDPRQARAMTLLAHGPRRRHLRRVLAGRTEHARRIRGVSFVIAFATLIHAVGFYGLHLQQPPVRCRAPGRAVADRLAARARRRRAACTCEAGPWVGLLAAAFTLPAELGLRRRAGAPGCAGARRLVAAHVLLGTSASLLAPSSMRLGYLAKERALKRRRGFALSFPSLESLDRGEHLTLALGFALLTLGVATGFAWGLRQGLDPWTRHTFFLLAAWAVYLLPVGARVVHQQQGSWPARGVVWSFAFLAFSYIGIRLLGAGA